MNTMDKEEFLKATKNAEFGIIIYNYCIEKGKSKEDSEKFVEALSLNPLYIFPCLSIASDYFYSKFNIIDLLDKNGKIIKTI
jgi:hypothetical protein